MPKVIYLQDLCSGVAGSVHDLQDYEANVLIRMGFAKPVKTSEIPTDGLLLNLNDTPVVGDFGDLIPLTEPKSEQPENTLNVVQAAVPKKSSKKNKG